MSTQPALLSLHNPPRLTLYSRHRKEGLPLANREVIVVGDGEETAIVTTKGHSYQEGRSILVG
jgi:hypothetical protein